LRFNEGNVFRERVVMIFFLTEKKFTIKKIMEEEKKVREETIFAPVPEEIRRPTYLE